MTSTFPPQNTPPRVQQQQPTSHVDKSTQRELNAQQEPVNKPARTNSIPRKKVQVPATSPSSRLQSSPQPIYRAQHGQQYSDDKPSVSIPLHENADMTSGRQEVSILDRSRPVTQGSSAPLNPQDVVDRAKTNTYDTEVVETVAPGKSFLNSCK